jgi:hypothetical protein
MEEASATKHEFVAGQVYALAGASERHNRIAANILAQLWAAARGSPCAVYGSDMRLRIGETAFYYPDVQVVCDPSDSGQSYKIRPCVIVEVLSPSTESIDLREKWLLYSGLDSLQAYPVSRDRDRDGGYLRGRRAAERLKACHSAGLTSVPNAARSRTARSARTLRLSMIPRSLSDAMNVE